MRDFVRCPRCKKRPRVRWEGSILSITHVCRGNRLRLAIGGIHAEAVIRSFWKHYVASREKAAEGSGVPS